MTSAAAEEIVWIESEDGLRLDGAVHRPTGGEAKPIAVVQVHGHTGRFSHPVHIRLGRGLAHHGYVSVTGNNRGWAFGETTLRRGERVVIGGGWERFHETPLDIGPWVDFALGLGVRAVALLGHSFGGPKVVYYQAQRQDPRVVALICASPGPMTDVMTPTAEALALAKQMVAEGRGQHLLPWGSHRGSTLSAQAVLDRAPANRATYDVFGLYTPSPAVGRVACPILAFYGSRENLGMPELERIRRAATAAPRVDIRIFEGADHAYTGQEQEVASGVAAWLDSVI
ncbi:MAG: alpha/beta hydrolase [Chloroflexota bacterium]